MMPGGLLDSSFMSLRSMSWWVSSVWRIIEECFDEYPARRRVARLLFKYGLKVTEGTRVKCGDIEVLYTKIAGH